MTARSPPSTATDFKLVAPDVIDPNTRLSKVKYISRMQDCGLPVYSEACKALPPTPKKTAYRPTRAKTFATAFAACCDISQCFVSQYAHLRNSASLQLSLLDVSGFSSPLVFYFSWSHDQNIILQWTFPAVLQRSRSHLSSPCCKHRRGTSDTPLNKQLACFFPTHSH